MNNFTDRNVDRVFEDRVITAEDVGKTIPIQLGQEQFGRTNGDQLVTLTAVEKAGKAPVDWLVSEDDVGMGISGAVIPASEFQAANPIFILIFGLLLRRCGALWAPAGLNPARRSSSLWGCFSLGWALGPYGWGQKTPIREAWSGWVGCCWATCFHTTGELCISPVGLSMVTKLSPARVVKHRHGGVVFGHRVFKLFGQHDCRVNRRFPRGRRRAIHPSAH